MITMKLITTNRSLLKQIAVRDRHMDISAVAKSMNMYVWSSCRSYKDLRSS